MRSPIRRASRGVPPRPSEPGRVAPESHPCPPTRPALSRASNTPFFAIALLLTTPSPLLAQSLPDLLSQAATLYANGKPTEALALYDKAAEQHGVTPHLEYNRACALAAADQLDKAEAAFRQVDRLTAASDPRLAASARFNLGALAYRRAKQLAQTDRDKALDEYRRSEQLFRSTRDLDPAAPDAARNIELVQQAIKAIEDAKAAEQQKQQQQQQQQQQTQQQSGPQQKSDQTQPSQDGSRQQQQQPQDSHQQDAQPQSGSTGDQPQQQQQQQNPSDAQSADPQTLREEASKALEDLARRQEAAARIAKKLAEDAAKHPDGQPDPQRLDDLKKRQEQLSDQTRRTAEVLDKLADESRSSGEKDRLHQAAEQTREAQAHQQSAAEQLDKTDPATAAPDQSMAAEQLRQAAESLGAQQPPDKPTNKQPDKSSGKPRPSDQPQSPPQDQPESEAADSNESSSASSAAPRKARDLTAAQILEKERRDRELLNRLRRSAIGRFRPVDKDW